MKSVSVVIPTRNRKESLFKTIDSVLKQTFSPHEIIIVDASDMPILQEELDRRYSINSIVVLYSDPSVCAQRNIGIKRARGEYVFLLDDDILLDNLYLEELMKFSHMNYSAIVMSGLVLEQNKANEWQYIFPKSSFFKLLWIYIFQLGVWMNINDLKGNFFTKVPLAWLKLQYKINENTVSKSGWPILTNFQKPSFRCQIYGLGASVIKKKWLEKNLYDENLDSHGIGDNYGIAINLTKEEGVFVLSDVYAYHYKLSSNRLSSSEAYYNRVLALHYFITINQKPSKNWLLWSLLGNFLTSFVNRDFKLAKANLRLVKTIVLNKNPLLIVNTNNRLVSL